MTTTIRAALLAAALTMPAAAQTLSFATGAPPTSLDPHFHTLTPNDNVGTRLFGAHQPLHRALQRIERASIGGAFGCRLRLVCLQRFDLRQLFLQFCGHAVHQLIPPGIVTCIVRARIFRARRACAERHRFIPSL